MKVRAENVEGLGEDVVVDEAGVDGEASHHGDDVTTSKEDLEDLRSLGFRLQHSLLSTRRSILGSDVMTQSVCSFSALSAL